MGKYYFIGLFLAVVLLLCMGWLGVSISTAVLSFTGVNFVLLFSTACELQDLKGKRK